MSASPWYTHLLVPLDSPERPKDKLVLAEKEDIIYFSHISQEDVLRKIKAKKWTLEKSTRWTVEKSTRTPIYGDEGMRRERIVTTPQPLYQFKTNNYDCVTLGIFDTCNPQCPIKVF